MNHHATEKNRFRCGSALINFSFLLALFSSLASGYLYFQWNHLSAEKKEFGAARVQLKDQITSLETDLQASLKAQQTLKLAAETDTGEKAKAVAELAAFKASSDQMRADFEKLKKENASLKKLAVELKKQTQSLLAGATSFAEIQPATSVPTSHLRAATTQPSQPMKIKTINRTFNFVVFDLVPGVTLRVGDDAVVERDGRWISDLKIKQVYAQFASAEIRKEDDANLLQIGDSVKRV